MSILGIIYFIITLGIIVVVHEGGHLIVAKRNNTYCHEFSIGMGPKLLHFYTDKSGTEYNLRLIPLGGFVRIAGEDTGDEIDEKVPKEQRFDNKSKWQKFKILVAGATMNFILGIAIFSILGFFMGIPQENKDINKLTVVKDMPMAVAGIQTGDEITVINSKKVSGYDDIIKTISSDEKLNIEFIHEGEVKEVNIAKDEAGKVGVLPYKEKAKYKILGSIFYGFKVLFLVIFQTFYSLYLLFTGAASVSDLSGPVGIATLSSGALSLGIVVAIKWLAYLSMAIGVMNLLPIPALDGGRILFILIEAIIGKPINPKVETILNNVVFFALLALILIVTFFDIGRIGQISEMFKNI